MNDNQNNATLDTAIEYSQDYPSTSLDSPIAPCPITDNLIYIVPTRYAIAEQQANYQYLVPPYLQGRATAVRPLRQGYLYTWQADSKLKQYIVTDKGYFIEYTTYNATSLLQLKGGNKGIMVNGDKDLYLLYCEGVPLNETTYQQLNQSASLRQQRMTKIDGQRLSYRDIQPHTVPLAEAERVMAELQPINQEKQQVLDFYQQYPNFPDLSMYSSDYAYNVAMHHQSISDYIKQQNANKFLTEQELAEQQQELTILINKYPKSQVDQAGAWSAYKWQTAAAIKTWLADIKQQAKDAAAQNFQQVSQVLQQKQTALLKAGQHKQQLTNEELYLKTRQGYYRDPLPTYLIVLPDQIGLLQDVERIQVYQAARHEQWINYNSVRTTIAGFIRNLTTTSGNELKSRLAYRFRGTFEPTDPQIQQITELHQQIVARHQQYVTAYKNYLLKKPIVQMQLPYEQAKQHYQQGLPYQTTVEPTGNTLDQDVASITQPSQQYIPAAIFNECWDDICLYFYQKQQNIQGSNAGAEVNQRININAVNYWLDHAIPSYQKYLDRLHEQLLSNRASLFDPVYQQLAWRIDGTDPLHRECLDNVGYTCFMLQTATLKGVDQMVNLINSETSAHIFSLLITRGTSIFSNTVNIGARAAEFTDALSNDRMAGITKMLDLLSDTIDPTKASVLTKAQLANALASTEQAASGKWGELMRSFSSAILKLISNSLALAPDAVNKGIISTYNIGLTKGGVLEPMQFIPVRALPAIIMAWFSDNFKIQQQAGRLQVVGQNADTINKGIAEFIEQAPKIQTGQANSKAFTYYNKAGGVTGIVAFVIAAVNIINAGLYFNKAQENPTQSKQEVDDARSAYLYAGSAVTGLLANGYGSYLNTLKQGMGGERIVLSSMQGVFFTSLGAFVGVLGLGGALADSSSLSMQIAEAANNIDPALIYRQYAAKAQMALYATQAIIGAGLAIATALQVITATTAIGIFTLCMGPISWLLLAAGAVYLWAWSNQETRLQTFLSGCCWGTRPKYPQPTQQQLVEDIAELIKLLFKPTLTSDYQLANNPSAPVRYYRDSGYNAVYNRLNKLAIYLPAAEPNADIWLTLKAKQSALLDKTITNITPAWQKYSHAQWIPHQIGQGIVLNAQLDPLEIEELEAHIYYTNPIITMYNKQIAQIAQHLQIEDYYYRVNSSGVTELTNPSNCQYIKASDNLIRLTVQQLTPKA